MRRTREPTRRFARRRAARLLLGAGALLLGLVGGAAHALKSDADQPINIRARNVEVNEKTGVSVYRGNVVLTQGSLRVEADRLEVTLRDGRAHLIRAWGDPVRMQTRTDKGEDLRARAGRAVYRASARRIDLHDAVELHRDGEVVRGGAVHYALDDQTFTAAGNGDEQVTVVIPPAKPGPVR